MSDGRQDDEGSLTRSHSYGCLALGFFSLATALLFVVLGIRALQTQDLFAVIGLLTVFPVAFAAIGLASLAVGFQRFTSAGRASAKERSARGLGAAWQTNRPATPAPAARPTIGLPPVIHLPAAPADGRGTEQDTRESETA